LTRFDNAISIIDTATKVETAHVKIHNPEPPSVVAGRRFLYDASFSSSHGDSSCATTTCSAISTASRGISATRTRSCSTTLDP
jgi:hypothetical protein